MVSSPVPMRAVLHNQARKFIWTALGISIASTVIFNIVYTWPRKNKYEQYYKTMDPYKRMEEICSYHRKYMHTCPSELAKLAEEKGMKIDELKQ